MPEESAIAYAEAILKLEKAETDYEKQVAAHELVEAERTHLQKIGAMPSTGGVLMPIILLILVVASVGIGIGNSSTAKTAAEDAKEAAHSAERATDSLTDYTTSSCVRGNRTRKIQYDDYIADISNLKSDIDLLQGLPGGMELYSHQINAKQDAIDVKRANIQELIDAVAPTAIAKGSIEASCDVTPEGENK